MKKNLFGQMRMLRIVALCIGAMLLLLLLSGCGGAQPAPSASALEGFSSAYLAGSETQNGEMVTLRLQSLYTSDAALEYAWYIYKADHTSMLLILENMMRSTRNWRPLNAIQPSALER